MKNTISLILFTLLAGTANAAWVKSTVTSKSMYLMCSSNTGTDGDLLFEIPVQVNLVESKWTGSLKFEGSEDTYTSFELLLDEKLKSAFFGDVTDVSPLSEAPLLQVKLTYSNNYDLTLASGYRIVIPTSLQNVADPIVTADAYQNEIGVSNCELIESTYNSRIEEYLK